MCGIVGAVGARNVVPILLEGLSRLEYRGYDSAGVATVDKNGLCCVKRKGRVQDLRVAVQGVEGGLGIAHTRWATHGEPSETNAHPHVSGDSLAVVHNGIIENFHELKLELEGDGYVFGSDTDSEVIAHLVHRYLASGLELGEASRLACRRLKGSYAIALVDARFPDQLVVARHGSPLVLGLGVGENFCASDTSALVALTQRVVYLEDGDVAVLRRDGVVVTDFQGAPVLRTEQLSRVGGFSAELEGYRHFMEKEIHEQPAALAATIRKAGDIQTLQALFGDLRNIGHVYFIACGTSYHAASCARYWIESVAGIPVSVEVASEFRYRKAAIPEKSLFVFISQSGETADTLAALRHVKVTHHSVTLAICNVPESSIARQVDRVFLTEAGPEIGVASTKAFTTQLAALMLLTLALGVSHDLCSKEEARRVLVALGDLPALVDEVLAVDEAIAELAGVFLHRSHALFLGRGAHFPIAQEGALKLKEISYVHAEAYPAGELKHGPLALVDEDMPVVCVAPRDMSMEKLFSNLAEVQARGGELVVFADREVEIPLRLRARVVKLPPVDPLLSPILYVVPLQMLAYHAALLKGTDVDKPRNLAKSVTVE